MTNSDSITQHCQTPKPRRLPAYFACLMLSLFWQSRFAYAADFSSKRVGEVLYFTGKLTETSVTVIRNFIAEKGASIVIDSEGGDVLAGLSVGKDLTASDVEVIVRNYCISACANYIFLGAKRKQLMEGAVLGVHGAPTYSGVQSDVGRAIDGVAKESVEFFKSIGVDEVLLSKSYALTKLETPEITFTLSVNGVTKEYKSQASALDALTACLRKKKQCSIAMAKRGVSDSRLYFPSLQAMTAAGVKGIEAYPYPKSSSEMSAWAKNLGEHVELIGDFPI
ncbi:hypothetical protein GTP44_02305 [Duganella sp. FT50W]|uniref:Uncharacterized protein n=1 Tax=Duganella lactea TaxID=2692173 RepID=A0A6L8MDK0_9BURK|nr:hypothetical protein [Duganella lactea]MYM80793.1 hypothetical protein [Duganella lactea]